MNLLRKIARYLPGRKAAPAPIPQCRVEKIILPLLPVIQDVPFQFIDVHALKKLCYQTIDGEEVLTGEGFEIAIRDDEAHLIYPLSLPLSPVVTERVKSLSRCVPKRVPTTGYDLYQRGNWCHTADAIIMTQFPHRYEVDTIREISIPHMALVARTVWAQTRYSFLYFATEEEAIIGLMENSA